MRKLLISVLIIIMLTLPVSAMDLTAPPVPENAERFMPTSQNSLGMGILEVVRDAVMYFHPDIRDATRVCLGILATVIIVSIMKTIPGMTQKCANLVGTVSVSLLLLETTNSMIGMAADTVGEISEYGKLLLPVLSAALAAQGGMSASAALYSGTLVFDTVLSSLISRIIVPLIYLFLALSISAGATGEQILSRMQSFLKWLISWCLKTILYIFTGYIGITGVITGSTDAATLKVTKLTISGMVPVVGGILSDASEAVLVGAGTVKNAAGIYGLFAILAICIGPFLRIGVHYLLLKCTTAISEILGGKEASGLIDHFSTAMGFLLAMAGSVCLMLMISVICFMKGMG